MTPSPKCASLLLLILSLTQPGAATRYSVGTDQASIDQLVNSAEVQAATSIHVLMIQGAEHPGRTYCKNMGGWYCIPLHFELIRRSFGSLEKTGVRVQFHTKVEPPAEYVEGIVRNNTVRATNKDKHPLSFFIYTGHGVQSPKGEELLLFHNKKGERVMKSYDKLKQIYAEHDGLAVHFIGACRVPRDPTLGFEPVDSGSLTPEDARMEAVQRLPAPANVVSVFAVEPGHTSLHEGDGRSKLPLTDEELDKDGNQFFGPMVARPLESLGRETSKWVKEADANSGDYDTIQWHNAYFMEKIARTFEHSCEKGSTSLEDLVGYLLHYRLVKLRPGMFGPPCFERSDGQAVVEMGSEAEALLKARTLEFGNCWHVPVPEKAKEC